MLTQGGFAADALISGIEDDYMIQGFREGLRDYGWVEGQHVAVEYRFYSQNEQAAELASELVNSGVELLFATSSPAARAAKNASSMLPVVFAGVTDPVAAGLVASLSQPGGNLTGLSFQGPGSTNARRLQLLKELVPTITRVHDVEPDESRQSGGDSGTRRQNLAFNWWKCRCRLPTSWTVPSSS